MYKSDLVKKLQKDIRNHGDTLLQKFSISDEYFVDSTTKLSPHRVDKKGKRKPMNHKEFIEYCETHDQFIELAGL